MSDFVIEEVRDLDAAWPDIEPLLAELHAYHLPLTGQTLRDDWPQRQRAYLAAQDVTGPDGLFLLARSEGRPVGLIYGWLRQSPGIFEERFAYVDGICVDEQARRGGLGRALVSRAEQWFRARGAGELRLGVRAQNPAALAFWTSAGYQITAYSLARPLAEAAP